jgi:TfoX/Sxy family transcriptional regulator of competence genes
VADCNGIKVDLSISRALSALHMIDRNQGHFRKRTGMTHDPKELQRMIRAAAPVEMELSFKPMFGGIVTYTNGQPLAWLCKAGLALKVGVSAHDEFSVLYGDKPLQYGLGRKYVVLPDAMLSDRETLQAWIIRTAKGLAAASKNSAPKARASA